MSLVWLNYALAAAIVVASIRLVLRARGRMSSSPPLSLTLTIAARIMPGIGCLVAAIVYTQRDMKSAIITAIVFLVAGGAMAVLANRLARKS